MARFNTQRILPIILIIVIVVIAVAALVSLARAVFFSGNSSQQDSVVDISRDTLLSTTADNRVVMTVRGPIVADEEFNSYTVSVSPSLRQLTTYTGYLDRVVDQESLGNNVAAYEEFVHALDKANLTKGDELEGEEDDVRGICASGRVYEFSVLTGEETVKRLWTSTCRGSRGSLDASADQLRTLFLLQIPNANSMTNRVGF